MENLVQTLVPLLITKQHEMPAACRAANHALAYLMRVRTLVTRAICINFYSQMYCTFVSKTSTFNLIYYLVDKVDRTVDVSLSALRDYKLDFMRVLSEHEHWLPLCLPITFTAAGAPLRQRG